MKTHTADFKDNVKLFGREIDNVITYTDNGTTVTLGNEQLNSVTPHYEGSILKSVMKQLDIDSNVDIPVGTQLSFQFGVKVRNNTVLDYRLNYDYISYGNYIVYKSEKQEDLNSYKITCYDKMLYSMVDYSGLDITYPITIRDYIDKICESMNLTFKNKASTFVNYDKTIPSELFIDADGNSLGYTFRDVLDQLAEVTASTICINETDDKLEIRYINTTNDTINEEYLKDVNVKFGEQYGPVNAVVLSRSESDNIYAKDEVSIETNGLTEIKIKDNQIMNFDDTRSEYLTNIFNQLNGFQYCIHDYSSTGICYYNLCDKYTVSIDGNNYSCIMFNDEVNITQGLQENTYKDKLDEDQSDYKYMTQTDQLEIKTSLIVDKVNKRITAEAERIDFLASNFDSDGNVTKVKTTSGFTFNADGLNITKTVGGVASGYNTQIDNEGTYYKDGDDILGQTTKDGSKFKDMDLYGIYRYGKEDIDDEPMFVAQLYIDDNNEEGFGHFYNGG